MANEYIADGIYHVSGFDTTLKNGAWVSDAGTYLVTGQAKLASIPNANPGDIAFTAGYTQIWQLDTDGTTWVELPKTAATTAAAAAATSATEAAASAATATAVKNSIPQDYTTLSNDVVDLKNATEPLYSLTQSLLYPTNLYSNNNTAVTNNNDGTYTIGSTDYGTSTFGTQLSLEPGMYYLFGVPHGESFLSTKGGSSNAYSNAIAKNDTNSLKLVILESAQQLFVGFRINPAPSESFTITPALYFATPKVEILGEKVDGYVDYRNNADNNLASMSANYFDADTAVWTDGIMAADGSITASDQHEYAYCPLRGAGTYITMCNHVTYGATAYKLILVDDNYNFVKSLTATDNNDGHVSKYTLTEEDYKIAKYAVMQRKKTGSTAVKLYYNPANSTVTDYTKYQDYAIKPDIKSISDPLYKKVVVCDGDSIGAGSYDLPKQWGAWFGRLQAHYQVTGHNYSVGGASITQDTGVHVITTSIDTIYNDYPTLDYLILEGGTNDPHYAQSAQGEIASNFGTFTDSDFSGNYDISTFCGAVENLFYKAVTYYPNAKIGFIIYLETSTSKASYADRNRYFDKIAEIAQKWHVAVLDLRKVCHATPRLTAYYDPNMTGSQAVTAKKFFYDSQHPTSYGYDLIQPIIEAWLKTL